MVFQAPPTLNFKLLPSQYIVPLVVCGVLFAKVKLSIAPYCAIISLPGFSSKSLLQSINPCGVADKFTTCPPCIV